jgi:hypothetical protein
MKANENRQTEQLKSYIVNGLKYLDASAQANVIFCVTYSPMMDDAVNSSTVHAIEGFIQDEKLDQIDQNTDYFFLFDNSCIKYLAERQLDQVVRSDEACRRYVEASWEKNSVEMNRFLKHVASLPQHSVEKSVYVFGVHQKFSTLAAPLLNVALAEMKNQKELSKVIRDFKTSGILPRLVRRYGINVSYYPSSSTVCNSASCTLQGPDGMKKYKKICHEGCKTGVWIENCKVMMDGKCLQCGCDAEKHEWTTGLMGIRCDDKEIVHTAVSKMDFVENAKKEKKEAKKNIEVFLAAAATCALYLSQNTVISGRFDCDYFQNTLNKAINMYNDLKQLDSQATDEAAEEVQQLLNSYTKTVQGLSNKTFKPEDVKTALKSVCEHRHYGSTFRESLKKAAESLVSQTDVSQTVNAVETINFPFLMCKLPSVLKNLI